MSSTGPSREPVDDTGEAVRLFVYVLDSIARAPAAAVAAHVTYLRMLDGRGALVVGGPYRDRAGAVVCVRADGDGAADAIARADPLVAFGFTLYELHEIERIEQLPSFAFHA
jgi:uncharacterized protein YciI